MFFFLQEKFSVFEGLEGLLFGFYILVLVESRVSGKDEVSEYTKERRVVQLKVEKELLRVEFESLPVPNILKVLRPSEVYEGPGIDLDLLGGGQEGLKGS